MESGSLAAKKRKTDNRPAKPQAAFRGHDTSSGAANRTREPACVVGALPRIRSGRAVLGLTGLSFALTCVIFPDIGWWPISFVCLTPWLVAVCTARSARLVYFASWLLGVGFFYFNIRWMIPVTIPGYLAMCFLFSLSIPLVAWPVRHMYRKHGASVALVAPIAWVAAEYLRSIGPLGFPWLLLGHTMYERITLIQISDLVGAWGVSFLVVMINGWLTDLLIQPIVFWRPDQSVRLPVGTVATGLLVTAALFYGGAQSSRKYFTPGPRVAVVQHDFPAYVDAERSGRTSPELIYQSYLDLTRQAAGQHPDLILLPETVMQGYLNDAFLNATPGELEEIQRRRFPPGYPRGWMLSLQSWSRRLRAAFQKASDDFGVPILLGSSSIEWKPTAIPPRVDAYNSAFLLRPGSERPAARYDKVHLVLFGEYVPFRFTHRWLYDWLNGITPWGQMGIEYSLTSGGAFDVFEIPAASLDDGDFRAGVPICYEEIMPYVTREFVRRGNLSKGKKGIDVLLSISNDGWFLHSSELEQHLASAVFRAVEHRIAVARSVNTGASAIIHPNGKIHARVRLDDVARLTPVDHALSELEDMAAQAESRIDAQTGYDEACTALRTLIRDALGPALREAGSELTFMATRLYSLSIGLNTPSVEGRRNAAATLRDQIAEDRRTVRRWEDRPDLAPGYAVSTLNVDERITVYSRWGDWFAQAAVGLAALMVLDCLVRRIVRRRTSPTAMEGHEHVQAT